MTKAKNRKQQRCGPRGPSKVLENETTGHALYISGEHHAQNLDAMQAAGITDIVACGCPAHFPAAFQYFLVKLEDNAGANVGRWLPKAANFIAAGLERGSVLVHCKAGICRSTTMILAYLIKFQQHSVSSALSLVREARQCVNPRREFLIALEAYAQAQASDWREIRTRDPDSNQLHLPRQQGGDIRHAFELGLLGPSRMQLRGPRVVSAWRPCYAPQPSAAPPPRPASSHSARSRA